MEVSIEPPCKTEQEGKEHKKGKGGAVLVEGRYIADLDGLGAGGFYLDSVGTDDLFFAPTGV